MSLFIIERPDLHSYLYQLNQPLDKTQGVVPEDIGKKISKIYAEELISKLTQEDAFRLIEIHKEVKKVYINFD